MRTGLQPRICVYEPRVEECMKNVQGRGKAKEIKEDLDREIERDGLKGDEVGRGEAFHSRKEKIKD